jgi:integrase/recombinase XerD
VLSPAEVKRLLNAPDTSNLHGIRNRAILEVLYSSGIRVGELCALTIYDVDLSAGFLRICHGVKGARDRLVPVGHTARRYLHEYLRNVRKVFAERYRDSRKLFIGYQGGLTVTAVQIIVRRTARDAGLEKRVTPHVLRHTCATHMILEGADIVQVQRILGHADLNSTQIYTRLAPVDAKREHRRSHPSEQQQVPRDFKPVRKLKPDYKKRP